MNDPVAQRIAQNPKYEHLRRTRNRFGWWLTALMLLVYYGYIALIAFNKPFMAAPLGAGVTSVGIPLALAVIAFSVVVTGIYVRRANGEFDRLTQEIIQEAGK